MWEKYMGALSNYLESGILNHIFKQVPYVAPSSLYIGLNKSFIVNDLESGIADEPTTGSYARQQYISSGNRWANPYQLNSSMAIHNNYAIEFPLATAAIGLISGVFISDAPTSGNILFFAGLSSSRNIREGDQFTIPSGSLKVTLD
jgi:hypothetical protein